MFSSKNLHRIILIWGSRIKGTEEVASVKNIMNLNARFLDSSSRTSSSESTDTCGTRVLSLAVPRSNRGGLLGSQSF